MVQTEVLCRVFRIKYERYLGTAFTIESHEEQFLVTAKHLFKDTGFPNTGRISLLIKKDYQPFDVDIRYPPDQRIDIAVMKLKEKRVLTPFYNNINSSEGLIIGQDVFFTGFPFEYDSILAMFPGGDMPIPFIKKACMSAILQDGIGTLLLDGINNSGFSGGPVCFKPIGTNETSMHIIGVVSGYRCNRQPLFDSSDNETTFYVKENTGLIIVNDITHATQIADNWV